jgi:hypothetical protein
MAKIKMLCPFSKKLCRECAQYRGRHYYLCFCSKYRGYLGNSEEQTEHKSWPRRSSERFEMPSVLPPSSTWLVLNEFAERKGK